MNIDYNKIEHLKLLEKKSVILKLNSEDSKKLTRYSAMTTAHLDWCIREHYLELLENFRKEKIKTFEFSISFENIGKLTSEIRETLESNLILVSPTEKSLAFSDLLEEVFDTCEGYLQNLEFGYEDIEFKENSKIEVKNSVEEIYSKIHIFLNEE